MIHSCQKLISGHWQIGVLAISERKHQDPSPATLLCYRSLNRINLHRVYRKKEKRKYIWENSDSMMFFTLSASAPWYSCLYQSHKIGFDLFFAANMSLSISAFMIVFHSTVKCLTAHVAATTINRSCSKCVNYYTRTDSYDISRKYRPNY